MCTMARCVPNGARGALGVSRPFGGAGGAVREGHLDGNNEG